jgi:hypothetical protein
MAAKKTADLGSSAGLCRAIAYLEISRGVINEMITELRDLSWWELAEVVK